MNKRLEHACVAIRKLVRILREVEVFVLKLAGLILLLLLIGKLIGSHLAT